MRKRLILYGIYLEKQATHMKEKSLNNNLRKFLCLKFSQEMKKCMNNFQIQFLIVKFFIKGFKLDSISNEEKVEL